MHEYHFANYRLLVDDVISNSDCMDYLAIVIGTDG